MQPTGVFLALGAFMVYATWRAIENGYHHFEGGGAHYLSPFFSPLFFDIPGDPSGHAWFGDKPSCNAQVTCRWDNKTKMCVPN